MRASQRSHPLRLAVGLVPAIFLLALAACSDSTAPGPLAELAGTWDASRMVVTSKDDPEAGGDVIEEFGASFTLTIRSSGRYIAALTLFEQTREEEGMLDVSGSTLTFDPDDQSPQDATWSLQDGALVIDGDTSFDFNQNGIYESADLHLELERR